MPPWGGLLLGGVPPSRGSTSFYRGASFFGGSPSWGVPPSWGGASLRGTSFLGGFPSWGVPPSWGVSLGGCLLLRGPPGGASFFGWLLTASVSVSV